MLTVGKSSDILSDILCLSPDILSDIPSGISAVFLAHRSDREHWPRTIAVEVRQRTLDADGRRLDPQKKNILPWKKNVHRTLEKKNILHSKKIIANSKRARGLNSGPSKKN